MSSPEHLADLVLAAAALKGDSAALRDLEKLLTSEAIMRGLRSFEKDGLASADILQAVRQRLLLAPAGQLPKLATYRGTSSLSAWLQAVAARTAINLRRQVRSSQMELDANALPLSAADPDLMLLRQRHGEQLKRALYAGFEALSDRDAVLLRAHHLQGVKAYQLATAHGVSAATMSRWLTKAREQWLGQVRTELRTSLALSDPQLTSLLRGMQSGLQVSLQRWMDERG